MAYEHTQRGYWFLLLFAISAGGFTVAWTMPHEPIFQYICLGASVLIGLAGLSFMHLTVRDETDSLSVCFGPVPLLFTRIPYDEIRHVAADRSKLIDGWGMHWVPGRGTTYSIWGFSCVRIELDRRTVRIGSDDVERLVEFLQSRISTPNRTD